VHFWRQPELHKLGVDLGHHTFSYSAGRMPTAMRSYTPYI
jgi:hypothetical protein